MNIFDYLREKFAVLQIKKANCIFVSSDLGKIGLIKGETKIQLLDSIYNAILSVNPKITIVVPTANLNLIRSNDYFEIDKTKSYKMGAFSEYIRKKKEALRSFNPIWSLSAIGPLSEFITSDVSNHGYDENSSFSRLFKIENCFFLSLGNHPRFMLSIIHHIENKFKVPYRFTKSFEIKVLSNKKIYSKSFYLDVLNEKVRYNKRSKNKKIFENFENKSSLFKTNLGKSYIYYFNLNDFYSITSELFKKDINCWWK